MIKTRTEKINDVTYCAYCGKVLRDESNAMYHTWPEPPVVCQCEKAKEELRLYDEIKKLYNEPMHESLVDMKVSIYRDQLLKSPTPYGSFGNYNIHSNTDIKPLSKIIEVPDTGIRFGAFEDLSDIQNAIIKDGDVAVQFTK